MKQHKHLAILFFSVAVFSSQARVEFNLPGALLLSRSSEVSLIQWNKAEVRKLRTGELASVFYAEDQVCFKGEQLRSPQEVIFPVAPMSIGGGAQFSYDKPRFELLFLTRRRDGHFQYTSTSEQQIFIEPELTVPLHSFQSLDDLMLYLLRSPIERNRRYGLLISGGIKNEMIHSELQRLAKSGIASERQLANEALSTEERIKEIETYAPPYSPEEEQAIEKQLVALAEEWKTYWNASNWDKAFSLYGTNSGSATTWRHAGVERDGLAGAMVQARQTGAIKHMEMGRLLIHKNSADADLYIVYSGGNTRTNTVDFVRDPNGKWYIDDIYFPVESPRARPRK